MENKLHKMIPPKWWLAAKLMPVLLIFALIKLCFHHYHWEALTLNPLFTSLIAGTVFLIGFLISGVLTDYKESEKIPGEIAACLDTLSDEAVIISLRKKDDHGRQWLEQVMTTQKLIVDWLYRRAEFPMVLNRLAQWNEHFAHFEEICQPAYISRLKQEQNMLRKVLIRTQVIRDTGFVSSAYAIVDSLAGLVIMGLLFIKIEPFYESLFVLTFVVFLIIYMILLIRDLDNPFEYSETEDTAGEVSLAPIYQVRERLEEKLKQISG